MSEMVVSVDISVLVREAAAGEPFGLGGASPMSSSYTAVEHAILGEAVAAEYVESSEPAAEY